MKNDTLPATDYLKVFNREQEPPPVPPRQYPVHLPTVVVYVKGGAVQRVAASWPVRVIISDGDTDLGTVEDAAVETDTEAQRYVQAVTAFADGDHTLPPG